MGKAKKIKSKGANGEAKSPFGGTQRAPNTDREEKSKIVQELSSLDVQRRLNGCRLILNVFDSNVSTALEQFTTKQLCAIIPSRLLDTQVDVRLEMARAVRSMACSMNVIVLQRMVDAGVARGIIGIVVDPSSNAPGGAVAALEQLLGALAALMAASEDAVDDAAESEALLPALLNLAGAGTTQHVRQAAAEVLITASDDNPACTVRLAAVGGAAALTGILADSATDTLVVVCCGGTLLNMYAHSSDSAV
jgi:hypothetical protein